MTVENKAADKKKCLNFAKLASLFEAKIKDITAVSYSCSNLNDRLQSDAYNA